LTKKRGFFAEKQPALDPKIRYSGKLKNFYIDRHYGFITLQEQGNDIFVHLEDFQKAGIDPETIKASTDILISFNILSYKINEDTESVKAINLQLKELK
jgi:hypothetical protein